MYEETWIADAENEAELRAGTYDVVAYVSETDSYGYAIKDVEQVEDDAEE